MNIHDRARHLAAQKGITLEAARSELGRRGAAARKRKNYGRTRIDENTINETRKAHGAEPVRYWWND